MPPKIITIEQKTLIGMRINMSLSDNQTRELWQAFMPRLAEISKPKNQDLYSIQRIPNNLVFKDFTPENKFEKWAAIEVINDDSTQIQDVPEGMLLTVIEAGEYAVFIHRGPAHSFEKTMAYIFGQWMPCSGYSLDKRAQFEIMKPGYHPDNENAEEEVWVPIISKQV